jgi:hypothetical protein
MQPSDRLQIAAPLALIWVNLCTGFALRPENMPKTTPKIDFARHFHLSLLYGTPAWQSQHTDVFNQYFWYFSAISFHNKAFSPPSCLPSGFARRVFCLVIAGKTPSRPAERT